MPPASSTRSVSPEMSFDMTAAQTFAAWEANHDDDPAPCDDGRTWGALVAAWRADGASDLHLVALIAATTTGQNVCSGDSWKATYEGTSISPPIGVVPA